MGWDDGMLQSLDNSTLRVDDEPQNKMHKKKKHFKRTLQNIQNGNTFLKKYRYLVKNTRNKRKVYEPINVNLIILNYIILYIVTFS